MEIPILTDVIELPDTPYKVPYIFRSPPSPNYENSQ